MKHKRTAAVSSRARAIVAALAKAYPDASCELDFQSPLELLVATILSAQCTDARVNLVTPALFARYPAAADYAQAPIDELEAMIRSTGFFRNKARSIQGCCRGLVERHGGAVPEDMEALTALPGVGRKTANLIRAHVFGKPGIIVDTHVLRVSGRLGLSRQADPDKVEGELSALLPPRQWTRFSTLLTIHGRRCCAARRPRCPACPLGELCPGDIA